MPGRGTSSSFPSISSGRASTWPTALHPQTFLAYGMNGQELPLGHGAPLRLRVARQLGYKSIKYLSRILVTESMAGFGQGLGGANPEEGYSWWAGI